jgi:hypothetical protein
MLLGERLVAGQLFYPQRLAKTHREGTVRFQLTSRSISQAVDTAPMA